MAAALCPHGLRWHRCRPCMAAYHAAWEANRSPADKARHGVAKRNWARRRAAETGTSHPERHRPSKYEAAAGTVCPACGSVRTEVARTRTAPVLLCWRCGGRFAASVVA